MLEIRVIARATARKGKEGEVRKVLQTALAPTHAEPGCRLYEIYESDTPGRFYFYEQWKSQEALDKHAVSPHFKQLAKALESLVQGEFEINFVTPIE
jgi:quinol monooxygenase YgiN